MSDHLSVTAGNWREDVIVSAKITDMKDISSTVKLVRLHIKDEGFTFKAGQWVDMFIPDVNTVGGFSMCSAPDLLNSSGLLDLAIKYSKHPPAFWIHSKCQIGDEVKLRAGGDFYYAPQSPEFHRDLLLIAGGVGINPLFSILLHFYFLHTSIHDKDQKEDQGTRLNSALLLYSARNEEELVFSDKIKDLSQSSKNIHLGLFCTRMQPEKDKNVMYGRIKESDVKEAVKKLNKPQTEVFICGPLPFIIAMEMFCIHTGIPKSNIHFEKWW